VGRGVIHIGRIVPHKRVDRLSDLIADLPALGPLHLVGDDRALDSGLRARLTRRGARLHGILPAPALRAVMATCQFVASASAYEGFGMSLVEGMAAGLVPLANRDVPSFRGIITDGVDGFLVPFGDRAAAAHRVRRAMGEDLAQIGSRARSSAHRCGTVEVVARHRELYAEVARVL
jgi:alpha-1,3-mannosyltransferase